jgi:hypothetical protein
MTLGTFGVRSTSCRYLFQEIFQVTKDESAELKRRERYLPYLKPGENLLDVKLDTLRKREERNEGKVAKDLQNRKQQDQLDKEAASRSAVKIESERKALLLQELQPECLAEPDDGIPDENCNPTPDTSWKSYVMNELDLFLRPLEQLDFETLYWRLSETEVGKLILNMFGVELPIQLPAGWLWASICGETVATRSPSYSPRLAVWEFSTPEELIAAGEQWDRVYPQGAHSQTRQSPVVNNDSYGLAQRSIEQRLDDLQAKNDRLKRAYQGKMLRLKSQYIEARKKCNPSYKAPELRVDPPPPPQAPRIELATPIQLPPGHEWHVTKTSDWPRTE